MNRPLSPLLVILALVGLCATSYAQVPRDATIEVTATTNSSTPYITLNWPLPSGVTSQQLWKRAKGSSTWTSVSLSSSATSYADGNASAGVAYEYSLKLVRGSITAYGGIVAGYNIPLVEQRGNVILLVDNTMTTALAPEIAQLQKNLIADGWIIYRHDVPREAVPPSSSNTADFAGRISQQQNIRSIVQTDYINNGAGNNWALFILGRIPVPYSGYNFAPDGHGEHVGAWPTDGYYGTDGTAFPGNPNAGWTDDTSSQASATDSRNWNLSNDGKFINTVFPAAVKLQIGRVDLSHMSSVPTGLTETELLRQYLVRDDRFRRFASPYNAVARRGLVEDTFGYMGGEAFSSSGWRTCFSWFGRNAGQADELDWFTTLQTTPMLFAYACGGGSPTSAAGIGTSTLDFNHKHSKAVFTMLFGSWFGDWDFQDDFLRAPLAGTANSLGLCSMWSGRGYYDLFHMALGDTVGYCVRFTQNDTTATGNWRQNNYNGAIHTGLVGDPTLRLHSVAPPTKVTATSAAGGITLSWLASSDAAVTGYHVYRSTSATGSFTRITGSTASSTNPTGSPLSALTYTDTDSSLQANTDYTYLIKAVKMETTPSGIYANQSIGELVTVRNLPSVAAPSAPTRLTVRATEAGTYTLTWDDNATTETGYLVERRALFTGVWSQIASLAADSVTYTDSAATVGQVNHYRVRAAGSSTNSAYSNEATDYNLPGLVYDQSNTYLVNKSAGSASLNVLRYNGGKGSVSLSYNTSDVVGHAGADYTSTPGTLTWAHAENGIKHPTIPIANLSGNQLTKIFQVSYSNPTNGLTLNTPSQSYVFINDTVSQQASQLVPWLTTTFGDITVGEEGYAEQSNGSYGLCVYTNGYTGNGSTSDSARFLYQPVTGDCTLSARLTVMSTTLSQNIFTGLMIRASLDGNAITDALLHGWNLTAQRGTRTGGGGTMYTSYVDTTTDWNTFSAPVWMRLIRTGNTIKMQQSADGVTWTQAGEDTNLSGLPSTVYIGLYLSSAWPVTDGFKSYSRFDNVSLTLATYPPVGTISNLTATAGTTAGDIVLNWSGAANAQYYLIERSTVADSGFTQIASVDSSVTTYTDQWLVANTTYYYRVKGTNPNSISAYSAIASSMPYLPSGIKGWRYATFSNTGISVGLSGDLDIPLKDSITNLERYALGYGIHDSQYHLVIIPQSSLPNVQRQLIGSDPYLTLTFVHNKLATDLTIVAEVADDVNGPWSSIDPFLAANQVSVTDNTPGANQETIVVKDTQVASGSTKRFMRLRITHP